MIIGVLLFWLLIGLMVTSQYRTQFWSDINKMDILPDGKNWKKYQEDKADYIKYRKTLSIERKVEMDHYYQRKPISLFGILLAGGPLLFGLTAILKIIAPLFVPEDFDTEDDSDK